MALRAARATRLHTSAKCNGACSCSYTAHVSQGHRRSVARGRWDFHKPPSVCARSSSHEEMYERLFNSPVFRSDLVMNEFNK